MELYPFLANIELFQGIQAEELANALSCMQYMRKKYKKGETVLRTGDTVGAFGVVCAGGVIIEQNDVWGNRNIMDLLRPGQIFAETYAALGTEPLQVNAVAAEDSEILFLDMEKLTTVCASGCAFHQRLISNLLRITASKNLALTAKIQYLTQKTIRARLLTYFSTLALQTGRYSFALPFNRQELADYLAVDRSALSNELSKMQKERLVRLEPKNRVTILTAELL